MCSTRRPISSMDGCRLVSGNCLALSWSDGEETHIHNMMCMIAAASIARQCHDKLDSGAAAPTVEDMRRFTEEAEAIAELWEEAR